MRRVWPRRFLIETVPSSSAACGWVGMSGSRAHVLDEEQMSAAEVNVVAGGQFHLAVELFAIDARAVETAEIADASTIGVEDLGMFAVAQFVLEDDAIGRGPAHVVTIGGGQGENVPSRRRAAPRGKPFRLPA